MIRFQVTEVAGGFAVKDTRDGAIWTRTYTHAGWAIRSATRLQEAHGRQDTMTAQTTEALAREDHTATEAAALAAVEYAAQMDREVEHLAIHGTPADNCAELYADGYDWTEDEGEHPLMRHPEDIFNDINASPASDITPGTTALR